MVEDVVALGDLASRLLTYEGGNANDPARLAEANDRVFRKLRGHIALLIGPTGYRAVLSRALQLAQRETPLLAGVELSASEGGEFQSLTERIKGLDQNQAQEAVTAVLTRFFLVLTGMLGWDIPLGLVRSAWPEIGKEFFAPVEKTD